ncbi:MAG: hypothetical protein WDA09_01430 [Bacteriovoracaceae bacterium]
MSRFSTPKPNKNKQQESEKERIEEQRASEPVQSDDELIDEAIDESFPASDPPGYRSKSSVDQEIRPD